MISKYSLSLHNRFVVFFLNFLCVLPLCGAAWFSRTPPTEKYLLRFCFFFPFCCDMSAWFPRIVFPPYFSPLVSVICLPLNCWYVAWLLISQRKICANACWGVPPVHVPRIIAFPSFLTWSSINARFSGSSADVCKVFPPFLSLSTPFYPPPT